MKRGQKLIALSLFSLLLISLLSLTVLADTATTQPTTQPTSQPDLPTKEQVEQAAGDWFSKALSTLFGGGGLSGVEKSVELSIVKFLFFFLIFLIILAVSRHIPLLGAGNRRYWIGWLISLIVAYLAVFYVTPEDFYTILISYTTMAIVITTLIPLAIIFALMYELASRPSAGRIVLQKLAIGLYAIVLAWRIVQIWAFKPQGVEISPLAMPVYGGTLIIILVLLIFNGIVRRFFLRSSINNLIELSKTFNKKSALAQAEAFREQAIQLEKIGDLGGAESLRDAANRIEGVAVSKD